MITVGVLRGGPSEEYGVSIKTGATVLRNLDEEKYRPFDIFIDKNGQWHLQGIPTTPKEVSKKMDVVFNALHGTYGEDGQVQRTLELFGIPYTGSGVASSNIALHKNLTKEVFKTHGIKTPAHAVLGRHATDADISEVFRRLTPPHVIKPTAGGSSLGVTIAKSFEEFTEKVKELLSKGKVLVEECVEGKEGTVGVVEHMREKERYALPPVEIVIPSQDAFFSYKAKYSGETEEKCPGNFSKSEKREMEEVAQKVHDALGLRHYSRTDFIVSPRGVYVLETNTLPGLTETSLLPRSAEAVGITMPELLDHLLTLALERK